MITMKERGLMIMSVLRWLLVQKIVTSMGGRTGYYSLLCMYTRLYVQMYLDLWYKMRASV